MTLNPLASEPGPVASDCRDDANAELATAQTRARLQTSSAALLRGGRELLIRHGEHEYRLRLTQNDKLILTK